VTTAQTKPVRIAVIGAGLIGRRHAELVAGCPTADLCAIVDPGAAGREVATAFGAPWFPSLEALLEADRPDGLIIATPNQLHAEHGMIAIRHRIPCLIEKPLTDSVASAEALVSAAKTAGVPILVGHHRRHNPIIQDAKARIARGDLGRIVAAHAFFWLYKPDDYFDVAWRREPGAGPVLINLIHDIDLLRYLVGEIDEVHAVQSNAARGHAVEDTTCAVIRFAGGALGTISVSDSIAAPWSWEMTSGENPAYSKTEEPCYLIGGTEGSLSIPRSELWRHPGKRSWWEPIAPERTEITAADPLVAQLHHFSAVIRSEAEPLVSGDEGLKSLKAVAAIQAAAARTA
jgi:predicted dehydrogenase